jgi:hypothetical protein
VASIKIERLRALGVAIRSDEEAVTRVVGPSFRIAANGAFGRIGRIVAAKAA